MAPAFNPLATTALELQSRLQSGSLTSVQILEVYLAQIGKHNHAGQKLNAIINVAPRDILLTQAKRLDEERKGGKLRGPLHGLPTIVKDCFTFAPDMGLPTTAGSFVFAREKAKGNAAVIQQLLDQGIIILGTANLTEFCGHRGDNMNPGYSAYGGQTRSAYDAAPPGGELPEFHGATTGGSSAGSGVVVSAGFVPFSIGTETGGSLIYPASKAGLYSIRPTLGSVSAKGCFRISRSFDGIGAMAKTPEDLAPLIEAILTPEAKVKIPEGGFETVMKQSFEGIRIGFVESTWGGAGEAKIGKGTEEKSKWGSDPVKSIYENAAKTIREHGAHVLYPATPPGPNTLNSNGLRLKEVAYHEFKTVIQTFCNEFENPNVKTLEDIINFNEEYKDIAMAEPHTTQNALIASRDENLSDAESDAAQAELRRLAGKDGMEKYMRENNLDMIISSSDCSLISFTANAGYPSATVPLGNQEDGSPFGLFLCVKDGREDLLFRFMSAFGATMPKVKGPELSF